MKMEMLLSAVNTIKTLCASQVKCGRDCPLFDENTRCAMADMRHMDLKKVNEAVMHAAAYGYIQDDMDTVTPYQDCFAYRKDENGDETCDALNGMYCLYEPYRYCRFFKDANESERRKR